MWYLSIGDVFCRSASSAWDFDRGSGLACSSRTISSLPRPGPPLRASIVPPCISTRPLTSDSPMPNPPCDLSEAGFHLRKELKDAWQVIGGNPNSPIRDTHNNLISLRLAG